MEILKSERSTSHHETVLYLKYFTVKYRKAILIIEIMEMSNYNIIDEITIMELKAEEYDS